MVNFYLNGQEAARVGGLTNRAVMPFNKYGGTNDDTSVYGSRTVGTPADFTDPFMSLPLTNVVAGDNVLAVELKQERSNSSDITMGLELSATLPTLLPKLMISRDDFGDVTLTWSSGVLQQSSGMAPNSWSDVNGAVSGYSFNPNSAGGRKFYRLR